MRRIQTGLSLLGLAGFLVLLATVRFSRGEAADFLILLLLGIAAEWFAIPLRNGWTTVSEAIFYAAILILSPARAGILAFTAVLGGHLAGAPRKNGKITVAAILQGTSLAFFPVLAAGRIYQILSNPLPSLAALVVAAVCFNLLNNGLAMLYVYLSQGVNPIEMWLLNQLDEQLLGFSAIMPLLGILLAILLDKLPAAVVLLLPIIFAIRQAMRGQLLLLANSRKTMGALVEMLDERDVSTYHHSMRVSRLAGMLARHLGLYEEEVEKIEWAAKIHDLGKIVILDDVLNKSGPLTEDEFRHMKSHPVAGASVAANLGFCREETFMVQCHHEKFDGTGYPLGLKGEKIPLGARIIAVADFFDALTSVRVYKKAIPVEKVIRMMENNSGKHFDPAVVEAFLDMMGRQKNDLVRSAQPIGLEAVAGA